MYPIEVLFSLLVAIVLRVSDLRTLSAFSLCLWMFENTFGLSLFFCLIILQIASGEYSRKTLLAIALRLEVKLAYHLCWCNCCDTFSQAVGTAL